MTVPTRAPLDVARLQTLTPAFRVRVTSQTQSTNADLVAAAQQGAPEWTVCTTDRQLAGRGRLGRVFTIPELTGIAVSALLRPDEAPPHRWPWLPLVAGLAVVDLARQIGVAAGLKWPNDVLADERRKLCGILVERVETADGPAAVVGIGLNVSLTREELPVDTATSLLLEGAAVLDRTDLLIALLERLRDRVEQWRDAARADELRRDYLAACTTIGRRVRLEQAGGEDVLGQATGIDDAGRLLVDGVAWSAGDVTHLRPI